MIYMIYGSLFYLIYCSIFYPRMIYHYNPYEAYYKLGEFLYIKDNFSDEKMRMMNFFYRPVSKQKHFINPLLVL